MTRIAPPRAVPVAGRRWRGWWVAVVICIAALSGSAAAQDVFFTQSGGRGLQNAKTSARLSKTEGDIVTINKELETIQPFAKVAITSCTGAGDKLRWNGFDWICDQETDPTVQGFAKKALPSCGAGQILAASGSEFTCAAAGFVSAETDPTVQTFAKSPLPSCGAGEVLGVGNGGGLSCTTDERGLTQETDPYVYGFARTDVASIENCEAGKVLSMIGGRLVCIFDTVGLTVETDPKVQIFAKNDIPGYSLAACGTGEVLKAVTSGANVILACEDGATAIGPAISAIELDDLNDVDASNPQAEQLLRFVGGKWTNSEDKVGALTAAKWCYVDNGKVVCDRDVPAPMPGGACTAQEIVSWDGTEWSCIAIGTAIGGALALDDLNDVKITSSTLVAGMGLSYDGADWVNGYDRRVQQNDTYVAVADTGTGFAQIVTDGTAALTALANKIGIGTNDPNAALDVIGLVSASNIAAAGYVNAQVLQTSSYVSAGSVHSSGTIHGHELRSTSDTRVGQDLYVAGNLYVSGTQAFDGVTFANGGVSASGTITATSFVGDGSQLTGLNNDVSRIYSGTTVVATEENGPVKITTAGTQRMIVAANGRVGISTTNPTAELEVNGTISATNLRLSGDLFVSGSQTIDGVVFANGGVSATGTISATKFYGDGSGISGIDKDRIVSGTSNVTVAMDGLVKLTTGGVGNFYLGTDAGAAGYSNMWAGGVTPNSNNFAWQVKNDGTAVWFNSTGYQYFATNNGSTGGLRVGTNGIMVGGHYNYAPSGRFVSVGAGDTTGITFQTQDVNHAALVTMLDSGKVGIGSDAPNAKLDVHGDVSATNLRLSGNLYVSGSQSIDGVVFANGGVSASGTISATNFYGDGSGLTGLAHGDRIISGTSSVTVANNGSITIATGGGETAVFGSNGFIGLGTSLPTAAVDVAMDSPGELIGFRLKNVDVNGGSAAGIELTGFGNRTGRLVRYGPNHATMPDALELSVNNGGVNNAYSLILNSIQSGGILFKTANTSRMFVSSTGEVGIGTTSPNAKLDVYGDVSATNLRLSGNLYVSGSQSIDGVVFANGGVSATGVVTATAFYGDGSGLTGLQGDRIISGTTRVLASEDRSVTISTANADRMVIGENGYVGIGLANPGAPLDVAGGGPMSARFGSNVFFSTAADTGLFWGNWGTGIATDADNNLKIATNVGNVDLSSQGVFRFSGTAGSTRELVRITNAGNVGIGTQSPTAGLQVSGSMIVSASGQTTTPTLYVGTNGKVGIGTKTPGMTLEVADETGYGGIKISDHGSYGHNMYLGSRDYWDAEEGFNPGISQFSDGNKVYSLWSNAAQAVSGGGVKFIYGTRNASVDDSDYPARMEFAPRGYLGERTALFMDNLGRVGVRMTAPTVSLDVSGTVKADAFVGDGSGLTGVVAATADRIVSGTTRMVAISDTGFISLTQAGTNTGWFDPQRGLVALGVSTTGAISASQAYVRNGIMFDDVSVVDYNSQLQVNAPLWVNTGGQAITTNGALAFAPNGSSADTFFTRYDGGALRLSAPNGEARLHISGSLIVSTSGQTTDPTLYAGTDGKVGIGTSSPIEKLNIDNGNLRISSSPSGPTAQGITFGPNPEGHNRWSIMWNYAAANGLSFLADNGSVFNMAYNGNVGIGSMNPNAKLDVYGTISATNFVGDGSGLTGVIAGATDRIISGTNAGTSMIAVSDTGYISITQNNGTNTGWFDPTRGLVTLGVSATGPVSATAGYFGVPATGFNGDVLTVEGPNVTMNLGNSGGAGKLLIRDRNGNHGGWIMPDAYNMKFAAGGALSLYGNNGSNLGLHVGAGGNVGVGTDAPSVRLQVDGGMIVSTTGQTTTPTLYVGTNGKIGIGTLAPEAKLDVSDTISSLASRGVMRIINNLGNHYTDPTVAYPVLSLMRMGEPGISWHSQMQIGIARWTPSTVGGRTRADFMFADTVNGPDTDRTVLSMRSDGRVGIGTTSPTESLDVVGTISATNFVGDGSGLTNINVNAITGLNMDRIVSSTTSMKVVSDTNEVQMTLAGMTGRWYGWYGRLVYESPQALILNGGAGVNLGFPDDTYNNNVGYLNAGGLVKIVGANVPSNRALVTLYSKTGSGTIGNGNRNWMDFNGVTSSTDERKMGDLGYLWRDVTDATRSADFNIKLVNNGTEHEVFRLTAAGNAGIGTDSPSGSLHILAPDQWTKGLIVEGPTSVAQEWKVDGSTIGKLAGDSTGGTLTISNIKMYNGPFGGWHTVRLDGPGAAVDLAQQTRVRFADSSNLEGGVTNYTALGRSSGGERLEVNNGTTGTLRDFAARSISSTGPTVLATGSGNVGVGTSDPNAKLDVYGTVSATNFVGDGSGLTGVVAGSSDRITSGTTSMIAISTTGFISLTQAATNTGWFDPTRGLVTLGVSATGTISGTRGFFGKVGIGMTSDAPLAISHTTAATQSAAVLIQPHWFNNSSQEMRALEISVTSNGNDANNSPLALMTYNGAKVFNMRRDGVLSLPLDNSVVDFGGAGIVGLRGGHYMNFKTNYSFKFESASSGEPLNITPAGLLGVNNNPNPKANLDVSGTVRVAGGTGDETCDTAAAGLMRRNPRTGMMQVCQ